MRLAVLQDLPSVTALPLVWPYRSPKTLRLSPPSCPTFVRAMFDLPPTARWADIRHLCKSAKA